jgi:hypothetical protein
MTRPGVPLCPRCGENDRVLMPPADTAQFLKDWPNMSEWDKHHYVSAPFCNRCMGFLSNLQPRPGRSRPDF